MHYASCMDDDGMNAKRTGVDQLQMPGRMRGKGIELDGVQRQA